MANQFRINNFNQSPPSGMTRRGFLRLSLGAAAVLAIGVPAYLSHENHTAVSSVQAGLPISGVCNVMDNGTLSPQFAEKWSKELPSVIASALSPVNDKNNPGFMLNVGDASYIYRLQDDDVVSEGMGYWMKILANASSIYQDNPAQVGVYQNNFDRLLNGVLNSLNDNQLLPWRMELVEEKDNNGVLKSQTVQAVNLSDRHSATDADLYIAWSLVRADALVKSGVWKAPAGGKEYYADLAAKFLSRIKAFDIIEKNHRHILTVSDGWGHKDVLRGAITVNPSYIVPAALEDFARFDTGNKGYWEKVQRDNLAVLEAAVNFSGAMYRQIADPSERAKNLLTLNENGTTYYVLDWTHKDLIDNLLGKSGYRLTYYGVKPLGNGTGSEKEEKGAVVSYYTKGKLFITKECFEDVLLKIEAAHVTPFVPDQLEVIVDAGGRISTRIEFGEARLGFTEKYDGIRGPKELGEAILASDDPGTVCQARNLLAQLAAGKKAASVRVDSDRNIIPLDVYLMASLGLNDPKMTADFEGGLNEYVAGQTMKTPKSKKQKNGSEVSGIHDPVQRAGDKKPLPRYYMSTISVLTLTGAIAQENRTSKVKVAPYHSSLPKTISIIETPELLPSPRSISGSDLIDAPLTYFLDLAANDGAHTKPQFPATAKEMFWNAKRQLEYYPDDAEVNYNYASALRNIGRYQAAAEAFYRTLLLAKFSNNPQLVMMTIFNLEGILKTLNFGEIVVGDLLQSTLDSNRFDDGTRMAMMVAIMREFNDGGNHVKAFKLGEAFLEEYDRHRSELSGGAWDKLTGKASPGSRLFSDALVEIMKSVSESGVPTVRVKGGNLIPTVQFEFEAAILIPRIAINYQTPASAGDLKRTLDLIYKFKKDVPKELRPKLKLAEAQIYLKMMVYAHKEIEKILGNKEIGRANIRLLPSGRGLFEDDLDRALETGKNANKILMEVINDELNGEQDPLLIYQALRSIIGINTYFPKLNNIKKEYEKLRKSLLDVPAQNQIFQKEADHDFNHALLLNRIVLYTLDNLSTADYAGIKSDKNAKEAILRIAREMEYDVVAEENLSDLLLIYRAAVRLAMANPSADPRNVHYVNGKIYQADLYFGWSEFSEFSTAQEKQRRLDLGLAALAEVHNVYLSNREHAVDLSMQSVMKMVLMLYKERQSLESRLIVAGIIESSYTVDLKTINNNIDASPKLTPDEKRNLKREAEYLYETNTLLDQRFAALLGEQVKETNDPIVQYFLKPENKDLVRIIFGKFPFRQADAWASWGDIMWWGRGSNQQAAEEAIKNYKKALQFNTNNVNALRGLSENYLALAEQTREKGEKQVIFTLAYRTYKKTLQSIQQGGLNEIILGYTFRTIDRFYEDNKDDDFKSIASALLEIKNNTGYSNEDKITKMLNILSDF